MKVSALALALVVTSMLAGCGSSMNGAAAESTRAVALRAHHQVGSPSGQAIPTTFVPENAGAAPAEMYPSL